MHKTAKIFTELVPLRYALRITLLITHYVTRNPSRTPIHLACTTLAKAGLLPSYLSYPQHHTSDDTLHPLMITPIHVMSVVHPHHARFTHTMHPLITL